MNQEKIIELLNSQLEDYRKVVEKLQDKIEILEVKLKAYKTLLDDNEPYGAKGSSIPARERDQF